jgi:hypothetical protein
MDNTPTASYKGFDLYPLVFAHNAARQWPERRPDRSYDAAVIICREGDDPRGAQAQVFRLDVPSWDNVGAARRNVLKFAEDIINGTVSGQSVSSL